MLVTDFKARPEGGGMMTHHQGGDDLVGHLLDGDHVAAGLRVDDALLLLPAHHDGLLAVRRAAHLLLLALSGQRGVGVRRDHGRDWGGENQTLSDDVCDRPCRFADFIEKMFGLIDRLFSQCMPACLRRHFVRPKSLKI